MSAKISSFVKQAREEAGLSQRSLATLINKEHGKGTITRSKIGHLELGNISPTLDSVSAITTTLFNFTNA